MERQSNRCLALFVLLFFLLLSVTSGATADNEHFTAFIVGGNADRVHLRSRPSQASDSLGLYFEGTPVTCYGSLREMWVPVQIGHEQGYMMSAFLSDQIEETYPLNETRRGIVRTDSWVNLRSEPSAESQALVQLQEGT